MNRTSPRPFHRIFAAFSLAAVLLAFGGCTRDPNARKQKYLESGDRFLAKQKYREAVIQYQNALQVDPDFAQAHYQLSQAYLQMGQGNPAGQELLKVLQIDPKNIKAHIDLGNLLLAARQFNAAQDHARTVLSLDPNSVDGHILLADSYALLENMPASLEEMQKAISLDPSRPRSYLNLALLQANAAQLAAAEQSFKKALELDPKSVTAMLSFGNFYQQQKRNPDAEVQYRKAMQTEPANSLPVVALGRLLLIEGRRAEAEQLLKDAKKNLHDNPSGYRLLGDFYFGTGDLPRATEEFASLVRQYPKDQKLKSDYIQLLILSNRLDEATKLNDEILKDSPKDIPGQVSRGQILLRQGKTQEAIQQLQAVISVEPDNAVAQYHLGLAFAQTGNLARAEVAWREAVRLRPGMASAQQGLAQLAIIKGNNDLLMESANALINIDSSVADGYLLRALARANRQDLAGAEADLRIAMAQAPADPTAYARLATIRAFQKKYPEAEKLYEQSLEKNPNFFEAMQGLVAIYAVQKQPQKALTRVQGQIAKAPSSALYVLLGQLYATQNQLDEAEAAFTKAMSLDKKNVEAYFLLAQLQTARGSLDKAAQSYEQSILQAPQEIRSYVSLGMLEEKRHNFPRARELYEKALRVQPDASNPWAAIASNNLAYLLLENGGNADVALSLAQTARQNFPKLPNFADTLAWVYYRKGAYGSAVDLLKSAIHDAPNNASAATFHYHLGMAYDKINDKAHAREELERALQLDPKIENAQEIRQVLSTLGG